MHGDAATAAVVLKVGFHRPRFALLQVIASLAFLVCSTRLQRSDFGIILLGSFHCRMISSIHILTRILSLVILLVKIVAGGKCASSCRYGNTKMILCLT